MASKQARNIHLSFVVLLVGRVSLNVNAEGQSKATTQEKRTATNTLNLQSIRVA